MRKMWLGSEKCGSEETFCGWTPSPPSIAWEVGAP